MLSVPQWRCKAAILRMAKTFEDEVEQTVMINEYIEGLEAEELEVDLVLGGEGKECTYPNGFMKRQAIFSCLTCVPSGNTGLCTACSLSCHDGHEVGLFFRLTFWEFSRDVMEPVAFFTTTIGLLVGYTYFLFTSRDPTYQDLMKRLFLSR